MSQDTVLFERRDAIARVTLNRPEVLNSFNDAMFARFRAVVGDIAADRSLRAVYLTGAGRAFCAGQDITSGGPSRPLGEHLAESWNPVVTALRELDRPVIAAVNGVAAGAGANLALAADFVVAAEEASFLQAFINIGLVPDTGGTQIVPQLIGRARATAHLMLGEKLPAARALEWGLIHRICPAAELEATAWALAARLAQMPTLALGLIKRLINASYTNSFRQQLEAEAEAQTIVGRSADHREGLLAFAEKRRPTFTGA